MKVARELVHGTCVAFGRRAALLRGEPGAGKSDLALRFLALPPDGATKPMLVADDQVFAEARTSGTLTVSAPASVAGKIEVRGLGIVELPFQAEAELVLVCDLVAAKDVPRMPPRIGGSHGYCWHFPPAAAARAVRSFGPLEAENGAFSGNVRQMTLGSRSHLHTNLLPTKIAAFRGAAFSKEAT